ncbi:hypothetical protein BD626DRAFT_573544 [Schizophyllum amplum]|uniref:Uncharacterized protein n=1 Tax=Schizophyllum amplum TaxID=97359 RepID=A0A550C184_9AGAR|nr:hypothetical protein BD626DRAFT_573544 [Auriculariopsis ampla]
MEAASLLLPVIDFPRVTFVSLSSSARSRASTSTRLFDCAEPVVIRRWADREMCYRLFYRYLTGAGDRRCLQFIEDCFAFAVVFARPLTSRAASDVAQALVIPAHQLCKHPARLTHKC